LKKLERHKTFLKDFRNIKLTDKQFQKLVYFLNKLLNDDPLPPEAKDHPLKGQLKGARELHLGGDVILIYVKTDTKIILSRIGSHSQLFKKY